MNTPFAEVLRAPQNFVKLMLIQIAPTRYSN